MRAYCKCCKEHYDTEECPDNHDPEDGVCWECTFTGKIKEADEEEEANSEDVALIQWNDPTDEYPKVEETALIASNFVDNVAMLDRGSAVSKALRGKGKPNEMVADVIDAWKKIWAVHKVDSAQEVIGAGGFAVVQAIREWGGLAWDRKTIPLTPRPTPAK